MMDGLTIVQVNADVDLRSRVMETAIEAGHVHGMGYWGDVVKVYRGKGSRKGRIVGLLIRDREEAGLTDADRDSLYITQKRAGREVWVHSTDIEVAIQKMLRDPKGCQCQGLIRQLTTDDLDGPLAEAIVQVACFGKVIYG